MICEHSLIWEACIECQSPIGDFAPFWELLDGEGWCPVCEEHMLTYDDKCVECGARTKPIGAK